MADYLDDLESDFSRFHRVDQAELDGPRWVRLGQRIAAYGGVLARRIEQQRDDNSPTPAPTAARTTTNAEEMSLTELRIAHPGLMSVTRVGD
ncbi:hypothetical protein ACWGB8_02025 [Kitasatospora sp. NPDC054939]